MGREILQTGGTGHPSQAHSVLLRLQFSSCCTAAYFGESYSQQQGTARTYLPFQLYKHTPGVLLGSFWDLASPGRSSTAQEGSRAGALSCSGGTAGSGRSRAGLSLLLRHSVIHTVEVSLSPSLLHARKIVVSLSVNDRLKSHRKI